MNKKPDGPLSERLVDELWNEISLLEGDKLDAVLRDLGLNPAELLQHYSKTVASALLTVKRLRLEEAKRHVQGRARRSSSVTSWDTAKKRQIFKAIQERSLQTKQMTIAARNQKIDAEQDLDSFLEACIRLGVIDQDGNLKI